MSSMNGANGTTDSWSSLPRALEKSVSSLNKTVNSDSWWQAFVDTKAIIEPITFGVQPADGDDAVLVSVSPGAKTNVATGSPLKADFVLVARPEQWEKFFAKDPKASYTSLVGLQARGLRVHTPALCSRLVLPALARRCLCTFGFIHPSRNSTLTICFSHIRV